MEKKIRVWLVVLLFLLLAALIMCVAFKLRLDDVNEKYNAVVNATPEATLEVTPEATGTEEPTAEPSATAGEPTVAGYTASEVEAMAAELETANVRIAELEEENARLAEADGTIAALQAENETLKSERDEAYAQRDEANAALETAYAERDEANAAAAAMTAECEECAALQAENEQLKEDNAAFEARIADLETELDAYRNTEGAAVAEADDEVCISGGKAEFSFVNDTGMNAVFSITVDGEALYTSDILAPGESIEGFDYTGTLAAGSYDGMFTVETCREDGSVATRMSLPVAVTVE